MIRIAALIGTLVLAFAGAFAEARGLPTFREYPSERVAVEPWKRPVFSSPRQRKFRTTIAGAARQGPNFAGTFAIALWGCGLSCRSIAVVDLETGRVFDGPFEYLSTDSDISYRDGQRSLTPSFKPIEYRAHSRLLIVRGCYSFWDHSNCALRYYDWNGTQFHLIKEFPTVPRHVPHPARTR